MQDFAATIQAALARLMPKRGRGIVAVSGGPDSVALVRALAADHHADIVIAHVNYGLRGIESDADEAFVHDLARSIHRPFESTRIAIPPGASIESTARDLRYEWLLALAHNRDARWIATGHTADDHAETILHRILRGTGLDGLGGIPESRPLDAQTRLVRPMLAITRADVLAALDAWGQSYRVDNSNADPRFTRNRIRHELLPLLVTFNSRIVDVLARLAAQSREVMIVIDHEVKQLEIAAELPRAGTRVILDVAAVLAADPVLRRQLFRSLWQREHWPEIDMTFDHWQRLSNLIAGDYPGRIRLARVGTVAQLGPPH
jgi:tRNA(Ile)-lysidine synthase